jgi:fucose permease
MAPIGAMATGALAERFSVRIGLACVAAGAVALLLAAVLTSGLRNVND